MGTIHPDLAWDTPLNELNGSLRAAGVEPVALDEPPLRSARDLDTPTRGALVAALLQSVSQARVDAPPVAQWLAMSESLLMNDDGSEAARKRADTFWLNLTRIVHGSLALVMLGELSELPFFVELLRYQPAGHLTEMATHVLCHYVDPSCELDTPRLIQRAEEWRRTLPTEAPPTSQVSSLEF